MPNTYNFIEIRKLAQMNQSEFAKELGITRESVNKIESGKSGVTKRTAKLLQDFVERHSISDFSQDVNILGKASHLQKPVGSYQEMRLGKKNAVHAPFLVPLVGIKAQAGYVKGFEEVDYIEALDQYSLPPSINPTGAIWRYFEIDGDSMEPTLSSGDVVLATMVPVEDWRDIKNFHVYVILTQDQLIIKRLFRKSNTDWVLISDNEEAYPQVLVQVDNIRQLWLFRRHIRSKAPQPKEFKIAV